MTFNDTQIPSNCKFTPNMDIKTWKPGVALMFERWSKSGTSQTFNDVINNGRIEDASEYMSEEQRQECVGKTAEEIAKNHFDSTWYAAGKTIPSDYESYISCDNSAFEHADMTIVVDPNTKEILLATTHSD